MAKLSIRPTITVLSVAAPTTHTLADDTANWQLRVRSLSTATYLQLSCAETPNGEPGGNATRLAEGESFGTPERAPIRLAPNIHLDVDAGTAIVELVEW